MSDLLNIGLTGVRAYQNALSTTSENIANAATPGYARRAVTLKEVIPASGQRLGETTQLSGNGVFVGGISRASDAFRTAEVRTTGSDLARTQSGVVWLDRIEGALTGNQLSERLTAFFNAAKGVAADPAATAPRAVMIENASSLATAFAGTGRALDAAGAEIEGNGGDAATQLGDLAASLVRVNRSLAQADENSSTRAQLLDERDRVLSGMSALVDVDVRIDYLGRATVRAGGSAGPVLADEGNAGTVGFATNSSGAVSFTVRRLGTVTEIPAHGGAFAGIADGATRIGGARQALNALATSFTTAVNGLQTSGRDLDGTAGAAMFSVGATRTDVTMTLIDPRKIAAAGVGEGTRGNAVMRQYETLRTGSGAEAQLDELTTGNAAALSARRDVATAQSSIHDSAVAAQQAVSGVDMDEEAVDLIRFQQAYQASSRVIQVARDTLQMIIDIR